MTIARHREFSWTFMWATCMEARVIAFRASGLHDALYNFHRNFVLSDAKGMALPSYFFRAGRLFMVFDTWQYDKLIIIHTLFLVSEMTDNNGVRYRCATFLFCIVLSVLHIVPILWIYSWRKKTQYVSINKRILFPILEINKRMWFPILELKRDKKQVEPRLIVSSALEMQLNYSHIKLTSNLIFIVTNI